MTSVFTDSGAEVFLIVVNDVLIAEDLAQAIAEVVPHADIIVTPALGLAQAAIAGRGRVVMACVQDDPALLAGSALAAVLGVQGARLVFLGDCDAAQAALSGGEALQYPFSTQDVHDLVRRDPGARLPNR